MALLQRLIVAIHDLHPWGGQDKSNLEILYHLNRKLPIEIHAYEFIDQRPWPQVQFVRYRGLRRPLAIKVVSFALRVFWALRKKKGDLVQSTGTAYWSPDVFQIQFLHKTWQELQNEYDLQEQHSFFKSFYHSFLQTFNVFIENRVYHKNKKYIAISHSIKKELIQHFQIPEKNITTIYHGVDPEHFCPASSNQTQEIRKNIRNELQIPQDAVVLLHTGALNQRKGVPLAIETLGQLQKLGFSNFHYMAVGAGDLSPLKKTVKNLNLLSKVHFIQHSKSIRNYYWTSDVFFFPTVYEPFGLVILEAMASGLVPIVSPSAGGSELIEHNHNGLLIENILDPESMAQQLSFILKDSDLRKRLAFQARKTAEGRDWSTVAEEYFNFYSQISGSFIKTPEKNQ